MKFNVFLKKDHGAHWVLSDGSPIFESTLFKTRPEAISNLEEFVTVMESPVFVDSEECLKIEEAKKSPSALVLITRSNSRWEWKVFISMNGLTSSVAECSDKGFDSFELTKQKAKSFCNSIVDAPILDQANVAIPGMHFSDNFEKEHHIGDVHPSSKWIK